MKLIIKILSTSKRRNIIAGILFILFINLIVFPYFSSESVNIHSILDLHFGFSINDIMDSLSSMNPKGRKLYFFTTLLIDTPYALVYGFVYAMIIATLLKKTSSKKNNSLILTPLLISFFDLVENTGIIYFCSKFPDINKQIAKIISISNQLKWIFAFLTLLTIVILIANKLRIKSARNKVQK